MREAPSVGHPVKAVAEDAARTPHPARRSRSLHGIKRQHRSLLCVRPRVATLAVEGVAVRPPVPSTTMPGASSAGGD